MFLTGFLFCIFALNIYYNKCFLSVFIDYNDFCYCEVIAMVLTSEMMHGIVHIFVILQRKLPKSDWSTCQGTWSYVRVLAGVHQGTPKNSRKGDNNAITC